MTGRDIYLLSVGLLGYDPTPALNGSNDILAKNTVMAINRILLDLEGKGYCIKTLSDELPCGDRCADALLYGVAMMLSLIEGDAAKQNAYCEIYNAKRRTYKSCSGYIKDTMPK